MLENGNRLFDPVLKNLEMVFRQTTDRSVLVVNNADTPPFATLINVNKTTGALTVVKRVTFDKIHTGVDATNGAKQPVWDPVTGKFYLSIPQTGTNVKDGAVIRITTAGTVERSASDCRAGTRPPSVRMAGWMPRANSRSSDSTSVTWSEASSR